MTVAAIPRPELTLPEPEAQLLAAEYAAAGVILEYGAGGSTALAASLPGKRVWTVESDPDWAAMMRGWLGENPPAAGTEVTVHWANIGGTRDWGHPVDESEWKRFPRYPLEVWQKPGFTSPDVVLVDGRFRIGCALAAAFLSTRPVTVLFDDYAGRAHYHKVERYLGQPRMTGRMARFEVTPIPVPPAELLRIIQFMTRP